MDSLVFLDVGKNQKEKVQKVVEEYLRLQNKNVIEILEISFFDLKG